MTALSGHAATTQATKLARLALLQGQTLRLRVVSGSMRPLLRPGDTVNVMAVAPAELQPGDLVVRAVPDEGFIVHRLLAVHGGMLITRGDSSLYADAPWPAAQLAGRVTSAWRKAAAQDGDELGRPVALAARWARPVGRVLAVVAWLRALGGREGAAPT